MQLLNAILIVTKCKSLEQLKNLSPERKIWLAQALKERVPSDLATLEEWNELIFLFIGPYPETDNKTAKKKLLCYLRGEEYEEDLPPATKIN